MADAVELRKGSAAPQMSPDEAVVPAVPKGISRRRFIGYLIAGPTLIAAVPQFIAPDKASAAGLPTHQPVDDYDLSDMLNEAAAPTSGLISVVVNKDGTVSFALPRAEVGQGITTAVAMTIADEIGIPLDKVEITLADARPELNMNQFTGGSNTMHSIFYPVRAAAAIAKGQLLAAAANILQEPGDNLAIVGDQVTATNGKSISIGALATRASVSTTRQVSTTLTSSYRLVGTPQRRIDGLEIVTGRKQFAMDLQIPDALPTMVCRPPSINGSAKQVNNLAQVKAMPGVTDVVLIPHTPFVAGGVAVRARTFGQCIDAVRALDVTWGPGPVAGLSDAEVKQELQKTQLPLSPANPLTKALEADFTFYFRPGDPLETNCAVADVTKSKAEVWSSLKSPIWCREQLSTILGMPLNEITVHVTQGGGSFGRHLFSDAAFEAAAISQKMGKPVKLMWHRTDNFRQGRTHPMAISKVRVQYAGKNVVGFDQSHASVATDFSMGFGEVISAMLATLPNANSDGYSQTVFNLTQQVPYNFGPVTQVLNEAYKYNTFNTGSTRNIYSPDVVTATELMVDRLAAEMSVDPVAFRRSVLRDERLLAVLDQVATTGRWGRRMAAGTAQGIGLHAEYKGACASLVEIDCRRATVNRKIRDAYTGPRVTKVVIAVDVGLPINPLGLEAQMIGGAMDGIANALTYSLHLKDGHFLEGSWDNAYYTREWNTPFHVQVIVMPPTTGKPGGAGELAVAPTMAAVACAYGRATGKMPTEFPINHNRPLGFKPLPTTPSIPQSPTNGLDFAY
ncbi:MAG TPA: molybdopterin cofactor-binding domain-containing protein [Solirubrobacteraceae bacterium]|nr:molybdopterin cofactor-binding domain-containing protein [Solirubrobacteraceae bacterium]